MRPRLICLAALLASAGIGGEALAQEKGTLEPMRLPPLAHPEDPSTPAKQLFGRQVVPAALAARTIGFYSRGCLAGGQALPVNGPAWEVMRLSRNRNWGHPALLAFLERFARKVPTVSHWPGILVGDMSQPRGGPMLTGHASHQIGLDADIWLTPMPNRDLSRLEREEMSAVNMVRPDRLDVDPAKWTSDHLAVIRAAAQDPEVQRIFVNAAIKKALPRGHGQSFMARQGPGRSLAMIIIFMFASLVRQGKRPAEIKIPSRREMAAMPRSPGFSDAILRSDALSLKAEAAPDDGAVAASNVKASLPRAENCFASSIAGRFSNTRPD
jgi:penicillin-insensitive murein endopeptidase